MARPARVGLVRSRIVNDPPVRVRGEDEIAGYSNFPERQRTHVLRAVSWPIIFHRNNPTHARQLCDSVYLCWCFFGVYAPPRIGFTTQEPLPFMYVAFLLLCIKQAETVTSPLATALYAAGAAVVSKTPRAPCATATATEGPARLMAHRSLRALPGSSVCKYDLLICIVAEQILSSMGKVHGAFVGPPRHVSKIFKRGACW